VRVERKPTTETRPERQVERGATVNEPAVWTDRLGKRYGNTWALRDCTIEVPSGSVCALLGPNGAGKTTLLHLLAGLNTPSAGEMGVFGRVPGGDNSYLADIGFLAQDAPLYRRFSVADHFEMGMRLNPRYDRSRAVDRVAALNIPLDLHVGHLSGGQRSQVALSLALAKRPRLLLLDEPVAALDPLARRDFIKLLLDAVREEDLTVIMSSHLVSDLERISDYVVLLASSQVQLCGTVASILDADLESEVREIADWDRTRSTRTKTTSEYPPSSLEEVVLRHMEAAVSTRPLVQQSHRGER